MKNRNFITDLILPLFWVFFFIASSNGKAEKTNKNSKKNNEIKKETIISTSLQRNTSTKSKDYTPGVRVLSMF